MKLFAMVNEGAASHAEDDGRAAFDDSLKYLDEIDDAVDLEAAVVDATIVTKTVRARGRPVGATGKGCAHSNWGSGEFLGTAHAGAEKAFRAQLSFFLRRKSSNPHRTLYYCASHGTKDDHCTYTVAEIKRAGTSEVDYFAAPGAVHSSIVVPHDTSAVDRDDGIVHELKKTVDALAHSGLKPDVIIARLKADAGTDETKKKALPTLQQVCVCSIPPPKTPPAHAHAAPCRRPLRRTHPLIR